MLTENIQRVCALNSDVCNEAPTAKQDCNDVVNIALFFDGTGNNKDADEEKKKWANPARLWKNSRTLIDTNESKGQKVTEYAIYVSGVGTKFNGELNFFQKGLAGLQDSPLTGGSTGTGGTRRLDYGEEQLNDALKQALNLNAMKLEKDVDKYIKKQKTASLAEVGKYLAEHRLKKKINISVFGFSRGAALARAFINQLIWQCDSSCDELKYEGIPIEFKFLGLFDTVASFGLPATNLNNNLSFKGRDLVVDERVKKCVHLIAGNEQRFAFPVDLISTKKDGVVKNKDWLEIIYPGMHSDVGGGYAPAVDKSEVSDNFARIPLKKMLDEAVSSGVKMYSYDELRAQHITIFEQQYKIEEETQRLYDAVKAKMAASGTIDEQVQACMKLFYSAYGTLARNGVETPNQKERGTFKNSWADKLIPWGPANMATEIDRLEKIQNLTAPHQKGARKIFKILSPVNNIYKWYLSVDDWEFESWHAEATPDITEFYYKYIHDSKYGFLANIEPFSYFRSRTIYESKRSQQGKQIDQQLKEQKQACSVEVSQDEMKKAYQQAKQEEKLAATS